MFTLNQTRTSGVWLVQIDGSRPRRLAGGLWGPNPSWSPDGHWVAVAATTAGGDSRRHLYVVSAAGGRIRQLATEELRAGEAPAWTPDGRWITYATFDGEVRSVHPDGTGVKMIANFPDQEVRHLSWSPDGRRLAYTASPIVESD